MLNRQDQSDLLASKLATASAGICFFAAGLGGAIANYGIAMGCFAAAVAMFIAAHKFQDIARLRLQIPISLNDEPVRGHWGTFWLITYFGLGLAVFLSIVFAVSIYIFDINRQLIVATTSSPYHWQMLSPEEGVRLRDGLRDVHPGGEAVSVECSEADCDDLAKSLRDVFRSLHWEVICCAYGFGTFAAEIHLWAADNQLRSVATKIEEATKGRITVDTSGTWHLDPSRYLLQITIGPKS